MGKVNRRKNRQKQKQKKNDNASTASASMVSRNPSSAVHQLRHPNAKIRHGALVALQSNFLFQSNSKKKQISLAVLQAIREQVMDNDMNCASSAAECLAQYISYHCKNETDDRNRQQQQQHEDVMASWTLVLIGRLKQCHEAISALLLQQVKPNNNNINSTKQWYALAAPCLRALCKLIEMNELALEQMNSQKQTFLSTIFGLLQVSTTCDENATTTSLDPKVTEWVQDTAIYAARCIHSSLDDNLEMVELLSTSQPMMDAFPSFVTTTTTTTTVPNLAQLHVAGCIVSLYQSSSSSSRRWLSTCIMNHVLPTLSRFMMTTIDIVPNLRILEENYRQARILWMTQKEDSELETSVLQSIQERKEPAREIARRLKQQQERSEKSVLRDNQEEDGRQAMENALTEWNDIIMPIQLALEVMANLLSCFIIDENDENDENETKMAVEDDDDDDLATATAADLRATLVTNRVTECIVRMLQTLCLYKKTRHHEAGNDELLLLQDDLVELISKVSACLSNCVLSKIFLVETTDFIVATTWKDVLRQYPMEKGVSSVMAAIIQHCPSLLCELVVQDLELFQNMLRNTNDETIQRDAVCLMAAAMTTSASSTAASEQVVTKCTNEMIQCMSTSSSSLGVKCEILNAIMDLYGNDDFHPQVFLTLNMIHHFQQCLASISIAISSSKDSNHLDPQEEEIMFNANRFVEYKLGR